MTALKNETDFLKTIRRSSFAFESLPDAIEITSLQERGEVESRPLVLATVDDIAFAQQGLNRQLSQVVATMEALRKLHDTARSLGAKGADYALEFIRLHGEVKV